MSRFRVEIRVIPRPGLLDPEGKAIQSALRSLDYEQVHEVRVGKLLNLDVEAASKDEARDGAQRGGGGPGVGEFSALATVR